MIKHLLFLFNLLFFLIASALLPAEISIEDNLPAQVTTDSTYLVEITLNKGALFGFAKFQQDLPVGFDVEPVETAEASFTYSDEKIKFIWMALPETETIKLSYKLTPRAGAPANGIVEGKFSYIEENERKSFDMPNKTITVVSPAPAEEGPLPVMASVTRNITTVGEYQYKVDLAITKQGIEGFAKVEEFLPEGAEASVSENNLAVFSQVDEKVKFVWMSIPQEGLINVSYTVTADRDIHNDLIAMEGTFSYLEGSDTKQVEVQSTGQPLAGQPEMPVDEIKEAAPEDELPMEEEMPVAVVDEGSMEPEIVADITETGEPPMPEAKTSEMSGNAVAGNDSPVTDIPAPETGVVYKVQILAGHKNVNEQFVRKKYSFNEDYIIDNHEGWIKYITGSFDVYRSARDKREALVAAGHNFPGPFVTAYNEGTRITVQEALMITNQQWFQ